MGTTTTTTKSSTTKIIRKIAKAKTSETDAETFRTAIAVMIKTRKQTKKAMKNKNKGQVAEEKDNYVRQRRKGEREVVKRGEQQRQQREAKDGKESDENNNEEEESNENNNEEEEASDENNNKEEEASDENNVVAMVTAVKW